jgi:hypothetical protein
MKVTLIKMLGKIMLIVLLVFLLMYLSTEDIPYLYAGF